MRRRLVAEEAARVEAARQRAERQAAERLERDRLAEEQRGAEAQRRADADRQARQQQEARHAAEQAAAERAAAQAERVAAERAAAERAEAQRAEAERAEAAAAAAAALARRADQTLVMVVDDSKVVRVKTSRLLAAHRFRVTLAEDGQSALSAIAQERPQVLVTDVEMPGLDGLSLTRALRADAREDVVSCAHFFLRRER